jgi:hypothetical protein
MVGKREVVTSCLPVIHPQRSFYSRFSLPILRRRYPSISVLPACLAQSAGVARQRMPFKSNLAPRSTRSRRVRVLLKNMVGLWGLEPRPLLCQRGDIKYSQQLTRLLGTAKYLIIPRSRTHLGLEFGLTIGHQERKITARLLRNKQVIYR